MRDDKVKELACARHSNLPVFRRSGAVVASVSVGVILTIWTFPWWMKILASILLILVLDVWRIPPEDLPEASKPKVVVAFHPKQRFETKLNFLTGISMSAWAHILVRNWRFIEWRFYWFRVLFLSLMAVINSAIGLVEDFVFGRKVAQVQLHESPVFVIGHPRTGTTHLHTLLALDSERFIYPDSFQCGFPHGMLCLDSVKSWLSFVLDETRPMDNVPLGFEVPQEDEIATSHLSGGASPYLWPIFLNRGKTFEPFYSFESATWQERESWVSCFLWFLKKVTFCHEVRRRSGPQIDAEQKSRQLVIKSPVHCSRIKLLVELFPKAQFIYIHRNPYTVWKSAVHMADTAYWYFNLETPKDEHATEFVFKQYEILFKDYMEAKSLLAKDQLIQISYDELTNDTVGTMHRIYDHFGWTSTWEKAKGKIEEYLKGSSSYQKNNFCELDQTVREYVYERWKASFDEFGYEK